MKLEDTPKISFLVNILNKDEHVKKHWKINGKAFTIFSNNSERQYKLVLALLFNKKYIKLNKIFEQWNIDRAN